MGTGEGGIEAVRRTSTTVLAIVHRLSQLLIPRAIVRVTKVHLSLNIVSRFLLDFCRATMVGNDTIGGHLLLFVAPPRVVVRF